MNRRSFFGMLAAAAAMPAEIFKVPVRIRSFSFKRDGEIAPRRTVLDIWSERDAQLDALSGDPTALLRDPTMLIRDPELDAMTRDIYR